jgi:eukaryotic-like serine/threonine-protein kinase
MVSDPRTEERLKAALAHRYRIEGEIGVGGMATVYLAQDVKHGRKVALKILKPELVAVIGTDRFLAEIRTTAKLQHPHILPLFDSGEAGGFLYYVTPYIEGESLRARLNRNRHLPVDEALSITTQVGAALACAHDQGIIHRDLKPENILLHRGDALLADFGIALAVGTAGGGRLTETGVSVGTPQYMSPEQAAGDRELDARSDLYSLAAVTYEMLAGAPPYTGSTAQAILVKVLSTDPEPVSRARHSVPANVDAAVSCALAKIPADRFPTVAAFTEALSNPAYAWSGSWNTPASYATVGRWKRWAALGIAGTALLAALALWGWLRPPPAPDRSVVRFSAPFVSGTTWSAMRHALAIAPGGKRMAYVAAGEGVETQLYLRELARLEPEAFPGTEGAMDPFFSPDGRWVGYATTFGLQKIPATGGPPVPIADFPEPRGVTWTAEDVIYFGSTSGLWRVPASGGAPEQVTHLRPGESLHNRPQVLPNGRDLLFTIATGGVESTQVAVYSAADERIAPLFPGLNPKYVESGHLVYGRSDGQLMALPFQADRLEVLGEPVSLVNGVVVKPTHTMEYDLSKTGTLVYLQGTARPQAMVLVDRIGQERPLSGVVDDNLHSPRFSPDGAQVVVGVGVSPTRGIWVYDFSDSTMVPITFEGHNYYPVWSPDGERVAYSSETDEAVDLRWTRSDGTGSWETLLSNGGWNYPGAFTPDSRYLVYREQDPPSRQDSKTEIMVLPLEGDRTPYRFLELPTSREEAPAISPDGRWLAYGSNLSGQYEVYLNGFPDPGRRRKISVDGGHSPVWSPDGRELFYRVDNGLVGAALSTTNGVEVLSRTLLFEGTYSPWPYHAEYDVAPDGRHFITVRRGEVVEDGQLVTVLNWSMEIQQAMEGGR